ncbi:alpha-L-rhamnosidase [Filimonas zeae]|uniref:alpha-L-rhamnosidase n=1 Tax=Filimonas zeae TaxID=1737353 RepID=A0A917IYL8_9BACT|nr:alpha-L-rhamnosidase [Filimonas zeae]MDR6339002.1 alpha-L-rhamnosidase [Filimonas zeae]GGH65574.1 alpha-L-rhamnosidase [Filimonas zeae]
MPVHNTKNIFFSALLTLFTALSTAQVKVGQLLTENRINPQGLDIQQPRFSWQLEGKEQNLTQTAYEIKVLTGGKPVWNSGQVKSAQSVQVAYRGPALQPGTTYEWTVRVWDNAGRVSTFSTPAFFTTGLQTTAAWKARWIEPGYQEDTLLRPCPIFRKQFTLTRKPVKAVVYITCHGVYEAQLNGAKVGDAYLTPGWTSYPKRLQYQMYDMGKTLKQGENTLEVMLGNGWYRGVLGFEALENTYGKTLALLLQAELTYSDGTKEYITTDNSWQSTTGQVQYADFYNGDIIDYRRERAPWGAVKEMDYGFGNLIATVNEPVRKQESFTPVKIWRTPKGELLADFGQNLVGWVTVKVSGQAGDTIRLDHGEVLDKYGEFYRTNLRSARCSDMYVLKGNGTETLEPVFTFHGFRYVRLKGFRETVKPEQLTASVIYSDLPQTGSFECSNPLLNQLHHNIVWSQNGNFVDLPTDCPQRDERMGWMGDAQLFSRTAAFNRNVNSFFTRWLADIAADQFADGSVPVVVPNILGGFGGVAGWSDAATIIPWNMFEVYGDSQLLAKQYPSMKAWIDFMDKNSTGYMRKETFQYGDWLSFTTEGAAEVNKSAVTDISLIVQAYYACSVQLLVKAATVLGHKEDSIRYTQLLQQVKELFVREYVTPGGRLVSATQTAYVLALHFDLLPEAQRAVAAKRLVDNIRSYKNHITTGLLGTSYICHVLSRFGYTDVAYDLLLQETYPSWLYPVKMGATTIWERWDGIKTDSSFQHWHMNSFNHYAYGAIGDWMYRVMAGIGTDSVGGEGYKKIVIKPHPGGGLDYVKAALQTYYGKVAVHWKRVNGTIKMEVAIPANTTATVYVPQRDGITYEKVSVGSGHYQFESK